MELEKDEIRISEIWGIIKKGLVFIIITSIVFAIGSFAFTKYFMEKKYTASVKLYVESQSENGNGYDNLQSYNYAEKLVSTYMQMLDTQSYYSDVSDYMNNKYTPTELSSMITFTNVEETEIFEADVVSNSPTNAKEIADAVAKTAPGKIEKINKKAKLKIVDEAVLPKDPTSPNTKMNVILAFLAGFVISTIFVFIKGRTDKKIKYNDDMTTIGDIPILATIPDLYVLANTNKKYKYEYTPSHGPEYEEETRGEN